jgi:hypothetical protein
MTAGCRRGSRPVFELSRLLLLKTWRFRWSLRELRSSSMAGSDWMKEGRPRFRYSELVPFAHLIWCDLNS